MPNRPPTHNELLGCGRKDADRAYNRRRTQDPASLEAKRFYASVQWQRLRVLVLDTNPLCLMCKAVGRDTPSVDVDHVVPMRDGGARADLANLQALCRGHHATKTRGEQRA